MLLRVVERVKCGDFRSEKKKSVLKMLDISVVATQRCLEFLPLKLRKMDPF